MTVLPPHVYLQVAAYSAQMALLLVGTLQQHVLLCAELPAVYVDSDVILLVPFVSPVPFVDTLCSNIAHWYLQYHSLHC